MAALILPRRLTSQPQYAAQVDKTNPVARGLINLYSRGFDAAQNRLVPASDASQLISTPGGMALSLSSSNYGSLGSAIGTTGSLTYVARFCSTGAGTGQSDIISLGDRATLRIDTGSGDATFYTYDGGGYGSVTASAAVAQNIPVTIVCVHDADVLTSANTIYIWQADVLTVVTAFCSPRSTGAHDLRIGLDDETARSIQGYVEIAAAFSRNVSDWEARSLVFNPWQLFMAQPKRLWAAIVAPAAPDQPADDSWDWSDENGGACDDTMVIESTAQYQEPAVAAPPQPAQELDDFTSADAYDDPTTDLAESSSGPVQPNAPPGPPDDGWIWDLWDDASSEDLWALDTLPVGPDEPMRPTQDDESWGWWLDGADDVEVPTVADPVGNDVPALLDDAPVFDEFDDELWWPEPTVLAADATPATDTPATDEWVWDEITDDWPDDTAPVGADAALPVDVVWQDEPELAQDVGDEQIDESAPVGLDFVAPDQTPAESWPEDDLTDELLEDSGPVGPDEPPLVIPDNWDWDSHHVDDDAWWSELPIQLDGAPVDVVLQDEPELAQDWGDEQIDDSGPVVADVSTPDQPPGDTWPEDDLTDEALEDSGPVGPDEPPPPAPDAWDWDAQHVDDDGWWSELPVALLDAPVEIVRQDDPDFAEDVGDELIEPFAPVGADEPPLTVADAWYWDEEPADDDTHWQLHEQPLVDFVALPGPTYADDWDWSGEDTDDDAQWLEITQPDASAVGPPTPSGPTTAELLAMIQALQAQLADVAKRAGNGGGGGDPVEYQLHRSRDAKRERIHAQNAWLMAMVGAMMDNRFGGKTANKEGAGGFVNPSREGKQP